MGYYQLKVFRCAIICLCLGALGRTGQGFFSVFVLERLSDGPVANLVHNFQLSSNIIICHLETQSKITAQRIVLGAGPIEALLEKHLGRSVSVGQKMIHTLKSLIEPFGNDLKTTSEEDDAMAAVIDNAQALSDRQFLVNGGGFFADNADPTKHIIKPETSVQLEKDARPLWARYKSKLMHAFSHRFVHRCKEMYSDAIKNCHEKLEDIQSVCYEKTPYILAYFTCRQMNALNLCKPGEIVSFSDKTCEFGSKLEANNPLTFDLEEQIESIHNISDQIKSQLKLNLHFKAIEEPANERIRALDEIKAEIYNDVHTFKTGLSTFKDILSALLVLLLYWIFRDSLKSIMRYLSDYEFQNNFITPEFWYVNEKRRIQNRIHFDQFIAYNFCNYGLMIYEVFSMPKFSEAVLNWIPLMRWLVLCFMVSVVILIDYYYYRVMLLVVRFGETGDLGAKNVFKGNHTLEINVKGDGPVAKMIKDILNFNFTTTAHDTITSEECMTRPRPPDWLTTLWFIGLPLFFMFLLQVVFNIVIRRITLVYIIGFIFPKRAKGRAKYLHHKLVTELEAIKEKNSESNIF